MILASLLGGCSAVPDDPLRVGLSPWIGNEPLVLAREQRLLDPARVKVVELSSGAEAKRNLRNGLVNAAALSVGDAARLVDSGIPVRVVGVLTVSAGGDAVMARPGIESAASLRGKRIAVEPGSPGARLFARLLEASGLHENEIDIVLIEAGHHERMLRGAEVDAVATFAPISTRLALDGYRTLLDSRALVEEFVTVLVVRADALPRQEDNLVHLLEAWARALLIFEHSPELVARLLATGAQLEPDAYLTALAGARRVSLAEGVFRLSGDPPPLAEQAAAGVTNRSRGTRRDAPSWEALFDAESSRRALAQTRDMR